MKQTKIRKASSFTPDIGHSKAHLHLVEVDNPEHKVTNAESPSNPKKATAYLNLGESPLNFLLHRGHIERHHLDAAVKFQGNWNRMGGAGAGSFDYSREMVDYGGMREGMTDAQMEAGKALKDCRSLIGARAYTIIVRVACEGFPISSITSTKREQMTYADILRMALDDLAEYWGLKTKGKARG